MKVKEGDILNIKQLPLYKEWEVEGVADETNIELKPKGKEYTPRGILVTQEVLDSWDVEHVRVWETGWYTREGTDVIWYLESEDGELIKVSAVILYNGFIKQVPVEELGREGLVPCKISVVTD